jgi:hypothetical protein
MIGSARRHCWIGGVLLIIAAAVFGIGINWGLPTKSVNSYLLPADSLAQDSTQAYRFSGAAIAHAAGSDWGEDSTLPADVQRHPVLDRSQPVTLLENPVPITRDQIYNRGDQSLRNLVAQQTKSWQDLQAVIQQSGAGSEAAYDARIAYLKTGDAVQQYVDQYNADHLPGFTDARRNDAQSRARILLRYRLYSYQPDEMITFRALSQMHPDRRDFDPRMYQYGGLWIYPIGGLLKAASIFGWVKLTADVGSYLDNPDDFARFYIVARAYAAAWGIVGVAAVFVIARRLTSCNALAAAAALCFIAMPITINAAHEAKPHLPGTALLLLALLAASNYVATGRCKSLIWTSIACGAAVAMVLSAAVGLILIPAMIVARRPSPGRAVGMIFAGLLLAVTVYFISNPYVAAHLIGNHQTLATNFANTRAMYAAGPISRSLLSAVKLLAEGASPPLAAAGILGAILLAVTGCKTVEKSDEAQTPPKFSVCALSGLLALLALAVCIQFAIFAAGKPDEYARFALFTDTSLAIAAPVAIGRICHHGASRIVLGAILIAATVLYGEAYEIGFLQDSSATTSRTRTADYLRDWLATATATSPKTRPILAVTSEPAPYCLPPVNLFGWNMILLPRDADQAAGISGAGLMVMVDESENPWKPGSTPISWANKTFYRIPLQADSK